MTPTEVADSEGTHGGTEGHGTETGVSILDISNAEVGKTIGSSQPTLFREMEFVSSAGSASLSTEWQATPSVCLGSTVNGQETLLSHA